MKFEKTQGLIAAPFTPMTSQGALNTSKIPAYFQLLRANGVSGAFICGSSGEGVSLTMAEKMIVADEWSRACKNDPAFKVIMMLGGTCQADCIELAKLSKELGFYGVAATSPFYYKPKDEIALADFCAKIANSVPDMPFYYYHIPVLTGVYLSMIKFIRLIEERSGNFAGIKYTHEDLQDFLSCLTYKDGAYDMLWGRDESLLSGLVLGVKSAVGSTYSYAAPLYLKIMAAFDNGNLNEAVRLQQQAVTMIDLLGKYGGIATGKSFMKLAGFDCGPFRSPVFNMAETDYQNFEKDAESINFSSFCSQVPQTTFS